MQHLQKTRGATPLRSLRSAVCADRLGADSASLRPPFPLFPTPAHYPLSTPNPAILFTKGKIQSLPRSHRQLRGAPCSRFASIPSSIPTPTSSLTGGNILRTRA